MVACSNPSSRGLLDADVAIANAAAAVDVLLLSSINQRNFCGMKEKLINKILKLLKSQVVSLNLQQYLFLCTSVGFLVLVFYCLR